MPARWFFEPSGRVRRGGSAAEYAFTPGQDVFVREVIQNSKDQRANGQVKVHFEILRLTGASLKRFLDALEWPELREHLVAAGENPNVRFLRTGVEQLESNGNLLLLRIDDFGTGGLTGGDLERDQPFASLCVDELFSVKSSSGAGGSYGLGKSVLWRFSQIATVLFSSVPARYPPGGAGLRLFGRTQLPWHQVRGRDFDGTCWFGRRDVRGGPGAALSWWGDDAARMAPDLCLDRKMEPGTSILVVGFSPPTEEAFEDRAICRRLPEAAVDHFWPVLCGDSPELEVTSRLVDLETGEVRDQQRATIGPRVRTFVECLQAVRAGSTTGELESPADVAAVDLALEIPGKTSGEPPASARVTLAVKLAPGAAKALVDTVAEARGFGMVVRYRELKGLSLSARRFHAVLICGRLRGDTAADLAAEEFLRLAEPPEHNIWTRTRRLRDAYKRGYGTALESLEKAVMQALKRLVSDVGDGGEAGPDRLSRLFPIGERGTEPREHAFRVHGRSATLNADGEWELTGDIERTEGSAPWLISVALHPATEEGADGQSILEELAAEPEGCVVSLVSGRASVEVPPSVSRVSLSGRSTAESVTAKKRRVAVRLDIGARTRPAGPDPAGLGS